MPQRNILELKFLPIDTTSYESARNEVERNGFLWEDWYYDRAVRPRSIVKDFAFWKRTDEYISMAPVCKIIGQAHPVYDGFVGGDGEPRWISFFYSVSDTWRKTDSAEVMADIVWHNSGESPVMLAKYGDAFFILDGRHRAVHAKFLKMYSMRCKIVNYELDRTALALYQRLTTIIGEESLKGINCFTDIESLAFTWHGIHFTLRWDEETLSVYWNQVSDVMRINANRLKKKLFLLFSKEEDKERRDFSLKGSSSIPDFRAALLSVL